MLLPAARFFFSAGGLSFSLAPCIGSCKTFKDSLERGLADN